MADSKTILERVGDVVEEGIGAGRTRHDEMRGERGLGRRHWPDMQVVHGFHPFQTRQMAAHFGNVNPCRNCK